MKNINDKVDMDKVIELGYINDDSYDYLAPEQRHCYGDVYMLDSLTLEDKKDLVLMVDFELIEENNQYRLVDIQGGNLANIENERFDSMDSVIDRLDVYFYDYLIAILTKEEFEQVKIK